MHVFTDCSSTPLGCSVAEGYDSSTQINDWQVNYAGSCGAWGNADPTRANFATIAMPVYIQVYPLATASTCLPYTLTITN
jgi:hypothetical protein